MSTGLGKGLLKGSLRVAGAAYVYFYGTNCTDPTFWEKCYVIEMISRTCDSKAVAQPKRDEAARRQATIVCPSLLTRSSSVADIEIICKFACMNTPDVPQPLRFRDVSNADVFLAAMMGIAMAEAAVYLKLIADGPAVIAALLFAGLFISIRMAWPLRTNAWFWPWVSLAVVFDLIALLIMRPRFGWMPALALRAVSD